MEQGEDGTQNIDNNEIELDNPGVLEEKALNTG